MALLTEREREVLTLIAMGERAAAIALALGVPTATVETHVRHCLAKLGAKNRAHAIALGLQSKEIAISLDSTGASLGSRGMSTHSFRIPETTDCAACSAELP